jgi:hypothetical protein
MNCPVCGGTLRISPSGGGAMCAGCDRLFAVGNGAPSEEILVPVGVDPLVHSRTLGFPGPVQAAPAFAAMPTYDARPPVSMAWMRMLSGLLGCAITALIVGFIAVVVAGSVAWSLMGHHHH